MSAPRLWVPSLGGGGAGEQLDVQGEGAHHLSRVLRVRAGDELVLFDGEGREARARVLSAQGRGDARVRVSLEEPARAGVGADAAGVLWLQGMPKGDKLENVVRQATELGARAVWPVYTERSVPRPRVGGERAERLRAVARAASAQCGRADVPEVREPAELEDALAALPSWAALRVVAWEGGGEPLGAVLARVGAQKGAGCAVLVGPEGGLSAEEVQTCRASGFVPVALGPRIWRTETVAPAVLGMLSLARGDLAPGG